MELGGLHIVPLEELGGLHMNLEPRRSDKYNCWYKLGCIVAGEHLYRILFPPVDSFPGEFDYNLLALPAYNLNEALDDTLLFLAVWVRVCKLRVPPVRTSLGELDGTPAFLLGCTLVGELGYILPWELVDIPADTPGCKLDAGRRSIVHGEFDYNSVLLLALECYCTLPGEHNYTLREEHF